MTNKLYAFGCSLTYGQGLVDCWDPISKSPGTMPSKFAWPQILADKLQYKCVNLSRYGSGNKEICFNILRELPNMSKDDLIFIQWSFSDRFAIIDYNCNDPSQKPFNIRRFPQHTSMYKKWFKNYWTRENGLFDTVLYIDYISSIMKKHMYKLTVMSVEKELYDLDFHYTDFLKLNILDYNKNSELALDRVHPNEVIHAKFADDIYKELIQ